VGAIPSVAAAALAIPLRVAADPQQRRVLAGEPHDVLPTSEADAVVAVRDAAIERDGLTLRDTEQRLEPRQDPGELGGRLHAREEKLAFKARSLYLQ